MLFEIPQGTKDFLPFEAKWKKEIEDTLHATLRSWGFRQVITPSYEYVTTLSQGESKKGDFFSFFNEKGDTFALRNDFTTPLARLAKIALSKDPRPLRLYYLGNLFRLKHKEKRREFWQAGAELIGSGSKDADAEILALATRAITDLGLKDWSLDIGHRGVLEGILEDAELETYLKKEVEALLLKKNYAGLKQLVKEENLTEDLLHLPRLRGEREILEQAEGSLKSPKAKLALKEIASTLDALKPYGAKKVNIDLAMVKDFTYYTGIFFEGYTPGVSGAICTGGRYDRLLENFGKSEPAVGFAIGIDEVLEALAFQKKEPLENDVPDVAVIYPKGRYKEAVLEAEKIRRGGRSAFIAVEKETLPPAKEYRKL